MNCRNFEAIITELAREQILDTRARADALAHLELCSICAGRFADERALSAGLGVVSASASSVETPAHIEAVLVSAFRQRTASPLVPSIAPVHAKAAPWMRWSIAAAVAILVVSGFVSLRLIPTNPSEAVKRETNLGEPALIRSPGRSVDEAAINSSGPGVENRDPQVVGSTPFQPAPSGRQRRLVRDAGFNSSQIRNASNVAATAAMREEIVTDFLPLGYGSNLTQLDDPQVVRVELPRSALQSFGLPMNAERASERVKADVLLGHDGVARAIRFVR